MELDVTAPRAAGNYPAILYLTGLEGVAPNWFQAALINQTVQRGHIWLTVKVASFSYQEYKVLHLRK